MRMRWTFLVAVALSGVLGVVACPREEAPLGVPSVRQALQEDGAVDAGPAAPDAGAPGEAAAFNPGFIGAPCTQDAECSFKGGFCLTAEQGLPGGHCTARCTGTCPKAKGDQFTDTFCVGNALEPGEGLCVARCGLQLGSSGCREGYACTTMPRFHAVNAERLVCMPDTRPPAPETACTVELKTRGLRFGRPAVEDEHVVLPDESGAAVVRRTCQLETPILLASPLHGVDFRASGRKLAENVLVSCRMALALEQLAGLLAELDVVEVEHVGTYNCRGIAGSTRLSAHAQGNAVDIKGFERATGTPVNVLRDWNGADAERRAFVRRAAQRIKDAKLFSLVLTPADNAAHADHFHVEIRE